MKIEIRSEIEVAALRKLGRDVDSTWVEWAVRALVMGHDSPSLRVLAGESGPFNQFEMEQLVDRTLNELKVPLPRNREHAATVLASASARQLLERAVALEAALEEIARLYTEVGHHRGLYEFYLLHLAYRDLEISDTQQYWPDANRKNFDAIVEEYCGEWTQRHPTPAS